MTTPAPAAQQRRPKRTFRITVAPGSPLDQLLDRKDAAKARLDEAQADFDAIDAEIKSQVTMAVPEGTEKIVLSGGASRPPQALTWHEGKWYAPAEWLRDNAPAVWQAARKQGRGYWGWGKAGG